MAPRHIALVVLMALATAPAQAYISPGPGLTMIGSLIALFGSIAVALAMVLLWPMRLFYKRWKARKSPLSSPDNTTPSTKP